MITDAFKRELLNEYLGILPQPKRPKATKPDHKICTACLVEKPRTEFYTKRGKEGVQSRCKECWRAAQLKRYRKYREEPRIAFEGQRAQAKFRGIEWRITLDEWLLIWMESGKWEQRGRGEGKYVMARFGDLGPYAAGNVKIILATENLSEAQYTRRIKAAKTAIGPLF